MAAAAVPLIASGISALGGWLANRKKQTTQQQNQTSTQNNLTMPEYDEKTAILRDRLINMFLSGAEGNEDLFRGYETEGLKNINRSSDVSSRLLESLLSSRGIRRTGMAGNALFGNEMNRLNQQSSFLNNIPLLRDQLQRQKMVEAGNFFGSIPKGARTTGTTNTSGTGTMTDPGNPLGGAVSNLGATLAYFYGRGGFGSGSGGGNNSGGNFMPSDTMVNMSTPNYSPYQSYFDPKRYNLIPGIK